MQVKDGYPGRLDMKPEFRSACTALAPPTYARPFACIATMGCLRTSCTISQIRCLPCRQPMPHTAKRCGKGPALYRALNPRRNDRDDIAQMTPEEEVLLLYVME